MEKKFQNKSQRIKKNDPIRVSHQSCCYVIENYHRIENE